MTTNEAVVENSDIYVAVELRGCTTTAKEINTLHCDDAAADINSYQQQPNTVEYSHHRNSIYRFLRLSILSIIITTILIDSIHRFRSNEKGQAIDTFQGVFEDPNHPQGYRIIVDTNDTTAQLQLQDEPDGESFYIPILVLRDIASKTTQLSIDFSAKGGPSDLIATVQDRGNIISFSDGNVWSKLEGVPGVYYGQTKNGSVSNGHITIRLEEGGTVIIVTYGNTDEDGQTGTINIPATISGDTIVFDFSPLGAASGEEGIFRNGFIYLNHYTLVKA